MVPAGDPSQPISTRTNSRRLPNLCLTITVANGSSYCTDSMRLGPRGIESHRVAAGAGAAAAAENPSSGSRPLATHVPRNCHNPFLNPHSDDLLILATLILSLGEVAQVLFLTF